jgi:hypothetical protein
MIIAIDVYNSLYFHGNILMQKDLRWPNREPEQKTPIIGDLSRKTNRWDLSRKTNRWDLSRKTNRWDLSRKLIVGT